MKPMVKYRGGKTRELPMLAPHIPLDFDRYVEPFFGGGAVYFDLAPKTALINDLNKPLMTFYRAVRDDFETLRAELDELDAMYKANRSLFEQAKALAPESRVDDPNESLYYEIRDMYNGLTRSNYTPATLYFFINKTSYSGMIRHNKKGEFNVPYGRYKNFNAQLVSKEHSELLQGTEIQMGDFSQVFEDCKPNDFVFLDPPYDSKFSDYGNEETREGFSEEDHRRLAEAFFSLPARSLMVIGKTPLTMELYGRNVVSEYPKQYAVNIRNRFKAESLHIVVSNH